MGAGASALPVAIDKATAKKHAGDRFDEEAFDAAADGDGNVQRDAFLKAAGEWDTKTSTMLAEWDAKKSEQAMAAAALSLVHDKRSGFLGAEVKDK